MAGGGSGMGAGTATGGDVSDGKRGKSGGWGKGWIRRVLGWNGGGGGFSGSVIS